MMSAFNEALGVTTKTADKASNAIKWSKGGIIVMIPTAVMAIAAIIGMWGRVQVFQNVQEDLKEVPQRVATLEAGYTNNRALILQVGADAKEIAKNSDAKFERILVELGNIKRGH